MVAPKTGWLGRILGRSDRPVDQVTGDSDPGGDYLPLLIAAKLTALLAIK